MDKLPHQLTREAIIAAAQACDAGINHAFANSRDYDVIINGTSGSLSGDKLPLTDSLFATCELAYDMAYGNQATVFMQQAAAAGAKQTADGLGMLVAQAAFSYQLWRGFSPDIRSVTELMRQSIQA